VLLLAIESLLYHVLWVMLIRKRPSSTLGGMKGEVFKVVLG
jgi:hypothetical protein